MYLATILLDFLDSYVQKEIYPHFCKMSFWLYLHVISFVNTYPLVYCPKTVPYHEKTIIPMRPAGKCIHIQLIKRDLSWIGFFTKLLSRKGDKWNNFLHRSNIFAGSCPSCGGCTELGVWECELNCQFDGVLEQIINTDNLFCHYLYKFETLSLQIWKP